MCPGPWVPTGKDGLHRVCVGPWPIRKEVRVALARSALSVQDVWCCCPPSPAPGASGLRPPLTSEEGANKPIYRILVKLRLFSCPEFTYTHIYYVEFKQFDPFIKEVTPLKRLLFIAVSWIN